MTKKIFWHDPYLTELDTVITSVSGEKITLQETIFFAFSGGQESDTGSIGGYEVLAARKEGKEIYYQLATDHQLKVGDKVSVKIDWQRRYKLMRMHFAAEIVLELVYKRFPNITKVGAHIAPDKGRIDFEMEESIAPLLVSLQQEAQVIINGDQAIICAFSDEENKRRYWKIDNFSQVPCGGTHVKRTGEIGQIKLTRVNPGKGKERIEIRLEVKN